MDDLLEDELSPGSLDGEALTAYVEASVVGYWHPVGTCAMGPERDAGIGRRR